MSPAEERLIAALAEIALRRLEPATFFVPATSVAKLNELGAELVEYVECEEDGETWLVAKMRGPK